MSRKSNKDTPVLTSGILYTEDAFTGTAIDGLNWTAFLSLGRTFYYDGNIKFTLRCEKRRRGSFWYAYRKENGRLLKRYVGRSMDLTAAKLREVESSFL